ncbi:MAG: hypothetical protein KDC61_04430 [Saprospiraceae bacterium]|nr:hypothetical protein [Saprospiraceae bacterium]MCB0542418.1 hypothetical protein [Saprospiraceae bacterium]MCB0573797.1 hypothetical protein [Saprospiraceae bacterium]MCB9306681.1 hypothetical protein [Lewinellaceae bacterium]MCB9353028.1 hypothetical protein [Lewinellaceae bacterium]
MLRQQILRWLPRVVAVVFIGLLILLSLDAFEGERTAGENLIAFLIHLIPAFLCLAALIVAWRYRLAGGVLFLFLGIAFTFYFGTARHFGTFMLISVPLFVAGALFLLSGLVKVRPA